MKAAKNISDYSKHICFSGHEYETPLLVYADDTCLIFQHKDNTEIETALNKNFSMLCDWFI